MGRSAASRRAQRGMALLGLLAVAVMVFAYVLTSRLNAASRFVGIDRDHNAKVLSQAKRALIGWIAINAAGTDNNPGRLPCPQAWGDVGSANEGRAAPNCSVPAAGWLPWRTLGLEKPLDASGNQIWYVISPGWHLPSAGATLSINSDTPGQLALDGQAAVALLIAPGPPLAIAPNANQLAAGCTAQNQSQVLALPGTAPIPLDFLDCQNGSTADNVFVASVVNNATNEVFNDQVLAVTAADVMPALEVAVAHRMQREIAPALQAAAYTSTQYAGIPAGVPLYPYPVPFTDPTTSSFLGATGGANPQGLLPFNQINSACTAPPPCTTLSVSHPHSVSSTLYGYLISPSCSTSATEILCQGQYHEDTTDPTRNVRIEMAATFADVAMGIRALAANPLSQTLVEARDDGATGAWLMPSPSIVQIRMNDGTTYLPDGTLPPKGSVTIRFQATLPNIDANSWVTLADFRIRINRAVFDDHALLKKTDPTVGWFVRNEWYRNTYYAVAQANTADWLPSLGCSAASANCVRFNDSGTHNIRALLVLAGRRLPTQATRPSSDRLAYVEFQNGDTGTLYEQRPVRMSNVATSSPFYAPWNDRVILVDWDPVSPPNAAQVVSLTPLRVVSLP